MIHVVAPPPTFELSKMICSTPTEAPPIATSSVPVSTLLDKLVWVQVWPEFVLFHRPAVREA